MPKLSNATLKGIEADVLAALGEVEKKHGVKFGFSGGSFALDGSNATLKLSVGTVNATGEVITREAADFKRYAASYGLKPEDLGKKFKTFSGTYVITGLSTKKWKHPILANEVNTGKPYKFAAESVKLGLAMFQQEQTKQPQLAQVSQR